MGDYMTKVKKLADKHLTDAEKRKMTVKDLVAVALKIHNGGTNFLNENTLRRTIAGERSTYDKERYQTWLDKKGKAPLPDEHNIFVSLVLGTTGALSAKESQVPMYFDEIGKGERQRLYKKYLDKWSQTRDLSARNNVDIFKVREALLKKVY